MKRLTDSPRLRMGLQLGMAASLGTAAWLLSAQLLESEREDVKATLRAQEAPVEILVATDDLQEGEYLSTANLALAETSARFLPEETVLADDFGLIAGRALDRPVSRGKPILASYLRGHVSERFAELVAPGQRALTIEVDQRMSIEGMIRVGDRLDLLTQSEADGQEWLAVLAEDVPVIATGSARSVNRDRPQEYVGEEGYYNTLTVVLDVQVAARALIAQSAGTLVTLLRGTGDHHPLPFRSVDSGGEAVDSGIQLFGGSQHEGGELKPQRLRPVRNQPPALYRALQFTEADPKKVAVPARDFKS